LALDSSCDNGQWCDGEEYCDAVLDCWSGAAVDCSSYDLSSVETCFNSPDDNLLTWDYYAGFSSVCDEASDVCTNSSVNLTHACDIATCNAECEMNADCSSYCVADLFYFVGVCLGNCSCDYSVEDCGSFDGYYLTNGSRWVGLTDCTEKGQVEFEFRDYGCSVGGCDFLVTGTVWNDSGVVRDKLNGTLCDDGLFCTVDDSCGSGVCSGVTNLCGDGVGCTVDVCNESIDRCDNIPDDTVCDNGQW